MDGNVLLGDRDIIPVTTKQKEMNMIMEPNWTDADEKALEIYNDEPEPDIVQQCIEDSRKRHKDGMNKSKIGQFVRAEYGYDVVGSVTYNDSRPKLRIVVPRTKKNKKNKGKK